MEDELKKLPLRSVPDDYADRVMSYIARVEAYSVRTANRWIAAQIAVTGVIALGIAWMQSAEIFLLIDSALEFLNAAMTALEQFSSEIATAFSNFQIEPLDRIAPYEWLTIAIGAGIVWLFVNGWLIVDLKKEKLA